MGGLKSLGNLKRRSGHDKELVGEALCLGMRDELGGG